MLAALAGNGPGCTGSASDRAISRGQALIGSQNRAAFRVPGSRVTSSKHVMQGLRKAGRDLVINGLANGIVD